MHKFTDTLQRNHAIVIGGGIAGLLATRILSNFFKQVTLIERDRYPDAPLFRPGVPQGRQVHTLLLRGQRTLETWFPGLREQLGTQGAIERDYGLESLYFYGGRCPQLATNLQGWTCSRLLLEWQIRQFVAHCPGVQVKENTEVIHLLFEKATNVVYGVQFRERQSGQPPKEMRELRGDLVVDASGASSHINEWLRELGFDEPPESVVNPHLGYATCLYQRPLQGAQWKAIAIQATEEHRRGGSLMEIEGGRWMVVLAGSGKDYPPTQPDAYLEFAQSLPDQALYEAIQEATPLSPIYGYRRTENRWRHLERLKRQPEGLIVMGDALCMFNPLYGQGMTVAILQAQILARCLRSRQKADFARIFQRKIARIIAFPWRLATAADARIIEEQRTRSLSQRYMEGLIALLPRDPHVLLTFLEVLHMLRSPLALFHPQIVLKVVRHGLRSQDRKKESNRKL